MTNRAKKWGAPIVEAPRGRRDEFVESYFRQAKPDQVVVILKAREPARIMIAIGNKQDNPWHLQIAQRWVQQYNFYVNDRRWGRISCACVERCTTPLNLNRKHNRCLLENAAIALCACAGERLENL